MNSIIKKIPNICCNVGKIVCNYNQALLININKQVINQYMYSFGYTSWNKISYDTIIKHPIRIIHNLENKKSDNLSRIYHPNEIIYPFIDIDDHKYQINDGDNVLFGILSLGFAEKIIIIPKKI